LIKNLKKDYMDPDKCEEILTKIENQFMQELE